MREGLASAALHGPQIQLELGAFLLRLAMSEYRTIIHCTEELESALLSDRDILNFLEGEGLIEPNVAPIQNHCFLLVKRLVY